jgi:hypothetical protein
MQLKRDAAAITEAEEFRISSAPSHLQRELARLTPKKKGRPMKMKLVPLMNTPAGLAEDTDWSAADDVQTPFHDQSETMDHEMVDRLLDWTGAIDDTELISW